MIVTQNEGRSLVDFAHPHHKTHVQHSKILLGVYDPTIVKDVQLGLL
jgi:hypothetical protein